MPNPQITGFVQIFDADHIRHRGDLAKAVNQLADGKVNTVQDFTLTNGALTHTFVDSRIGPASGVYLMPLTTQAAARNAGLWYVSTLSAGSMLIVSTTTATTSETFRVVILG